MPQGSSAVRPTNGLYLYLTFMKIILVTVTLYLTLGRRWNSIRIFHIHCPILVKFSTYKSFFRFCKNWCMECRAFLMSVKALDIFPCTVKREVVWKIKNPLVEWACYVMQYLHLRISSSASVSSPTDSEATTHRPFTIFCRKYVYF